MRRTDKEITDRQAIEDILTKAEVLRLAMCDNSEPYVVALNFAYLEGALYIHCAKEGRKIDILRKNSRVAFQTDTEVAVITREDACGCTTRYLSVAGTGNAELLDDTGTKVKALDALMHKHTGKTGLSYNDKVLEKTLIIRVNIDEMTGKKSGF